MLCREIMQVIEAAYPRDAALGFDNVGLLAGRAEKEVERVYLALDATDAVIDHALEAGADMLVAGSYLFGAENPAMAVRSLKESTEE